MKLSSRSNTRSTRCASLSHQRGLTIVEVIAAAAILGLSSAGVFRFLAAADTIRSRSIHVAAATQMVSNEVEGIRAAARELEPLHDTSYTVERDGVSFDISRRILKENSWELVEVLSAKRIEIQVRLGDRTVSTYRLIQGYDH